MVWMKVAVTVLSTTIAAVVTGRIGTGAAFTAKKCGSKSCRDSHHLYHLQQSHSSHSSSTRHTHLFGISEWRDDLPIINEHGEDSSPLQASSSSSDIFPTLTVTSTSATQERTLPVLIVPSDQVVVMGEVKYLHFTTDEEIRLFQQAIDCHHGMFAIGYVTADDYVGHTSSGSSVTTEDCTTDSTVSSAVDTDDEGFAPARERVDDDSDDGADEVLLDRLSLMEITNYRYMDHNVDMGIICTAQTMGRATLNRIDIVKSSSPSSSLSQGSSDVFSTINDSKHIDVSELQAPQPYDMIAAVCNEYFDQPEQYYSLEEVNEMAQTVVRLIGDICQLEEKFQLHEDRIVDRSDTTISLNTNHNEEDRDEEDETRKDRFRNALRDVMLSDNQGYINVVQQQKHQTRKETSEPGTVSSLVSSFPSRSMPHLRSWKELNAISWAAYSSSIDVKVEEIYRLHALDMNSITTRLQLAEYWLSDKLVDTQRELEKTLDFEP